MLNEMSSTRLRVTALILALSSALLAAVPHQHADIAAALFDQRVRAVLDTPCGPEQRTAPHFHKSHELRLHPCVACERQRHSGLTIVHSNFAFTVNEPHRVVHNTSAAVRNVPLTESLRGPPCLS